MADEADEKQSEGETPAANVDRAMDALERAAASAEHGAFVGESFLATKFDVSAAVLRDRNRVRGYLDRVIMGTDPEVGLDALLDCGALEVIFPEVHLMVGFSDGEWRHKDVWKHTKQVVRQSASRLEVRWGALFHDIGKVKTRTISPDGKVQFLGHAEVGTRMFDKAERRISLFGADPALQRTIRFLVLHHLRPNQYEKGWTDSAVRRFARDLGEHLDDLMCLARADITTKRPEKKKRGLDQIEDLYKRIVDLAAEDAKKPPLPSGVGDLIMKEFSIPPSRLIGDIKRALEAEIAAGTLEPHNESEFYVEHVRANRARYGF